MGGIENSQYALEGIFVDYRKGKYDFFVFEFEISTLFVCMLKAT